MIAEVTLARTGRGKIHGFAGHERISGFRSGARFEGELAPDPGNRL